MKVKVTTLSTWKLKCIPDNLIYGLIGEVITEYNDSIIPESFVVTNHKLLGDVLVYFPDVDFCCWLAKGEYEEVKERS